MGVVHTLAFILCFFAAGGIIFTTVHNEWKKNSYLDSQLNMNNIYKCEGLWKRCTSGTVSQIVCDSYETAMLALPAYLNALRAMMIIACIFSGLSFAMMGASLDCNASVAHTQRNWIRRASGVMLVLAGILTLASVSWYAAEVIRDFWQDQALQTSFQYEFGAALYVGWISSGLALIAGALMACCTCSDEEEEDYPRYTYNPSKAHTAGSRNTEYV